MKSAGGFDYVKYPGIAELYYLSCFKVDEMIMLTALECSFKLSDILAKLMFCYQITVEKQFNSIVQRCPAYTVILVLHENVKGLYIEMPAS